MNILISNDDGWDAKGLEILASIGREFGNVVVVAPETPQSGVSHQITFERPLRVVEKKDGWYSVDGTPADCIRIGLNHLGQKFDWVWSGINHGANLGADVLVSGTVAAAREAWLHGFKAIAFSQYRKAMGSEFDWGPTQATSIRLIQQLLANYENEHCLMNVNFPDLSFSKQQAANVKSVEVDPNPLPNDYVEQDGLYYYRGNYQARKRSPGSDVDVCFNGDVAISRLE